MRLRGIVCGCIVPDMNTKDPYHSCCGRRASQGHTSRCPLSEEADEVMLNIDAALDGAIEALATQDYLASVELMHRACALITAPLAEFGGFPRISADSGALIKRFFHPLLAAIDEVDMGNWGSAHTHASDVREAMR